MKITKHKVVSIKYRLTDDQGTLIDSSEGESPLAYLHGVGALVSGLEDALEGKEVGDDFDVSLTPAEAYGTFLRSDLDFLVLEDVLVTKEAA